MNWKFMAAILLVGGAIFLALFIAPKLFIKKRTVAANGALSLVVEPDAGIAPVLAMINGARSSLDIVMYELDDAQIEAAIVADGARGVAVRVILSGGYKGSPPTVYTAAYDFLAAHGVPVRWSPGYFSLTHEKSMIVDGSRALIMTFNWVAKYYATGRDFGLADTDPHDVTAMEDTFNDDWRGAAAQRGVVVDSEKASLGGNNGDAGDDLLWSPGSERPLIDMIDDATKSLCIYNEEMADMDVTKALIDAARRGIAVYVVMTNSSQWKWQFAELTTAGAHVRTYADEDDAPLYIHAKMIIADGTRAFVGSENFSKGSLDENRELGMTTQDKNIITQIAKIFATDWRNATPFTF